MNALTEIAAAPNFADLRVRYEAALAAERAHDAISMPGPVQGFVSAEAIAENDRLTDLRSDIEDELMKVPSPDAAAFAFKCLVAHGDGRQTDCWDKMLESEARRFAFAVDEAAHASWSAALADYQAKRAIFDGDQDTDAETDRLCDITFAAQDYLLAAVRAPSVDAFEIKLDLMRERDLGFPDEWLDALLADARHLLGTVSSPDPHMGWLAERDAIWSEYNGYTDDDEARDEPLAAAGRALEQRIIDTPATTRDGILAKALLIVGAAAIPGDDPDPIKVFDEARAMGLMEWMA